MEIYGVDGYALAVVTSRWRVFKDPKRIDIVSCNVILACLFNYYLRMLFYIKNFLPEPVLPEEQPKKEEKTGIKDLATAFGLGSFLSGGDNKKDVKK